LQFDCLKEAAAQAVQQRLSRQLRSRGAPAHPGLPDSRRSDWLKRQVDLRYHAPMPRFSLRSLILVMLLAAIVLPLVYAASYCVLLRPIAAAYSGTTARRNLRIRCADYWIGGQAAQQFFHFAHTVDYRLRTGYWEGDDLPENIR
jgi:hypothetical protein